MFSSPLLVLALVAIPPLTTEHTAQPQPTLLAAAREAVVSPAAQAESAVDETPQSAEQDAKAASEKAAAAKADKDAERIAAAILELTRKHPRVQAGLSLGWRVLRARDTEGREAAISPIDGKVTRTNADRSSVVLSGVLTVYPWQDATGGKSHRFRNLGFLANINFADFTADRTSVFNKSVEGGLGLALRLADDFAFGVTIERGFARRLRPSFPTGAPIVVDNVNLKTLDNKNDAYFYDDNVTAFSFKWIYVF